MVSQPVFIYPTQRTTGSGGPRTTVHVEAKQNLGTMWSIYRGAVQYHGHRERHRILERQTERSRYLPPASTDSSP